MYYVYYRLIPCRLKTGGRGYMARVQPTSRIRFNDVLRRMSVDYHSTVTYADALAVTTIYQEVVGDCLQEGAFVETGLGTFRLSVQHTFSIEPQLHPVVVTSTPSDYLQGRAEKMEAKEITGEQDGPVPRHLLDLSTQSINEFITPGGQARLYCTGMKVEPNDPQQGVFLVRGEASYAVKVIQPEAPARYLVELPATLAAGAYDLYIRTRDDNGQLRSIKFSFDLVVR